MLIIARQPVRAAFKRSRSFILARLCVCVVSRVENPLPPDALLKTARVPQMHPIYHFRAACSQLRASCWIAGQDFGCLCSCSVAACPCRSPDNLCDDFRVSTPAPCSHSPRFAPSNVDDPRRSSTTPSALASTSFVRSSRKAGLRRQWDASCHAARGGTSVESRPTRGQSGPADARIGIVVRDEKRKARIIDVLNRPTPNRRSAIDAINHRQRSNVPRIGSLFAMDLDDLLLLAALAGNARRDGRVRRADVCYGPSLSAKGCLGRGRRRRRACGVLSGRRHVFPISTRFCG